MNYLRSSAAIVIVVIVIGGCLSTSCADTIQADYSPRLPEKCLSAYQGTINSTQLFLNLKAYPHDIHKECITNHASKTQKILSTWIDLEDEDNLFLFSDCQDEKGSSPIQANSNWQATITVPTLTPIFLLKSSFLI